MSFLSKVRSYSSNKENCNVHDPHKWNFPSRFPASGYKSPVIPKPEVFKNVFVTPGFNLAPLDGVDSQQISQVSHPTSAHVAVHLCLLESFWRLKQDTSNLNISTSRAPPTYAEATEVSVSNSPSDSTADEKWLLLLQLAAERFRIWFESIEQTLRHASAYTNHTGQDEKVRISQNYLPPLDVLLMWYSFLSNPLTYRADVDRLGKSFLLKLPFPWKAIFDVIDRETMTYVLPKAAAKLFRTLCGQNADVLAYMGTPPAYTEQATMPFSIDLVAAAKGVDKFFSQSHRELLIRSPSLEKSIERSVNRYCQWMTLSRKYGSHVIIPPTDIEIVIRTQRVSPSSYQALGFHSSGAESLTVDQKDVKISPSQIDRTRKVWEEAYTETYAICNCWICERIRDDDPSWFHGSGNSPVLTKAQLRAVKEAVGFHQTVQLARERGLSLPVRPPTKEEREEEEERRRRMSNRRDLFGI